jgi:hypothetical protein
MALDEIPAAMICASDAWSTGHLMFYLTGTHALPLPAITVSTITLPILHPNQVLPNTLKTRQTSPHSTHISASADEN